MERNDEPQRSLRRAMLRGAESLVIGGVSAIAEGEVAIALSLGGAAKRYQHTDANEDVAAFAIGDAGILAIVADGHGGRDAAELVVGELLSGSLAEFTRGGPAPTRERWSTVAVAAIGEAHAAVLASVTRDGARDTSRTTLVVALVRARDDLLAFASMGDSHIFRVGSDQVVDVGFDPERRNRFLGNPADTPESLAAKCVTGIEELSDARAVVLASDGISEPGIGVDIPEVTVGECAAQASRVVRHLRPLETARAVAEAALAAHRHHRAGDNIATAAIWLDRGAAPS